MRVILAALIAVMLLPTRAFAQVGAFGFGSNVSGPATLAHFFNLPPGATLPAEAACAALVNLNQARFPETVSQNANDGTGWNANNQIFTTPTYYYTHAGDQTWIPNAALQGVDGSFSGTTQNIMRWSACKWGVDESWVYAETMEEAGWRQDVAQLHGDTTCRACGDCNNPDGTCTGLAASLSFSGFTTTDSSGNFVGNVGMNGANAFETCSPNNYASFGIIQNKAACGEWYIWPMVAMSTAWGEDYRWAKWRSCMNNTSSAWSTHFGSADYTTAVSDATSSPNALASGSGFTGPTNLIPGETNLQYLGLGCLAAHFTPSWYASGDISYLNTFFNALYNETWPGGRE